MSDLTLRWLVAMMQIALDAMEQDRQLPPGLTVAVRTFTANYNLPIAENTPLRREGRRLLRNLVFAHLPAEERYAKYQADCHRWIERAQGEIAAVQKVLDNPTCPWDPTDRGYGPGR